MSQNGLFITLEGVDGCGKSTQATLLVEALEAKGFEVLRLRDPGSTRLSEKIRLLLLDPANEDMCDECELLLYEAARAQLVREQILPALERGTAVVCERFFDSTLAYQAHARGLAAGMVRMANELGACGVVPTATLLFDIDTGDALSRATREGADRLEAEGTPFQRLVREGYLQLATENPERIRVVNAVGTVEAVKSRVVAALHDVVAL